MDSKILDIWESNNEALRCAGIITNNIYEKLFCLDIEYADGIRECLYFGWPSDTYAPLFEGLTLERFDMFLMARIERFAWRYRELILKGTNIMDVIKMDAENILDISIEKPNKQFVKRLFEKKKETN